MSNSDERTTQPENGQVDQQNTRPRYEAPRITKMSEADVLKSFQVTGAAASWWGM